MSLDISIDFIRVKSRKKDHVPRPDIVRAVKLTVPGAAIHTLMGPSGAGKSAVLSVIAGTLHPALEWQGRVTLNGQDVNDRPTHLRGVGLLFQDDLLFPHMSVAENLLFALPAGKQSERRDTVYSALENAGLEGFAQRDPATLSGGQRARVALLRSLLAQPQALLLDEPFSKLDESLREQFRLWVFSQIHERGIPALLVTHDREDVADPRALTYLAVQTEP
jgi:putative thiamine transport system ATP-binding protein